MALTAGERAALRTEGARFLSRNREPFALTKPEFREVIDAIDDWVDANAASFNQALPAGTRAALTTRQKAWLLAAVVEARWRLS